MRTLLLLFPFILTLNSCLQQVAGVGEDNEGATSNGFTGCSRITQMSETSFKIDFIFPTTASEVYIYRDGTQVFSTVERSTNSFTDEGLDEGIEATYTCYAKIDDKVIRGGTQKRGETDVLSPPGFAGITNAIAQSPTSVKVYWGSHTSGARPKYFQIFTSMVTDDGLFNTVRTTVDGAFRSTVIDGLADEMPYYFAVRACAKGDVCDDNTASFNLTTADKGKPTTTGPASAAIIDGSVVLTVPWEEANGGLKRRKVFRRVEGGTYSTVPTIVKTIASADKGNPVTEITDTSVAEATTYYYYVIDEDDNGNTTTQADSAEIQVQVTDLTLPIFAGLTNSELKVGSEHSAVTLTFTAGPTESENALTGITSYLLYVTESDPPANPADACSAADDKIVQVLSSSDHTNGASYDFDVEDLTPRKKYNFCLKAVDSVGNKSETTASETQVIRDIIPPEFFGLQNLTYNPSTQEFTLTWNASESSDIKSYPIWVWKNSDSKTTNPTTTATHATNPSSFNIGKGTFAFNDGDTVYFQVNACDNASPTFNTVDNCTDLGNSTIRSMTLDDLTPPTFVGTGLTVSMVDLSASDTDQVQAMVSWTEPTNLVAVEGDPESGFGGFRVYEKDTDLGTVTLLKDCACPNLECETGQSHSIQCLVTGLEANRDYIFYVSAYDKDQNLYRSGDIAAANLGNLTPHTTGTTRDDQKPIFNANFLSAVNQSTNNIELTWSAAQDNQETTKSGNQAHYRIFYKKDTDIADYDSPEADADATLYTGTALEFIDSLTDTNKWNPGSTYYFVACTVDQYGQDNYADAGIRSKHETCVGGFSKTLEDTIAPVISNLNVPEAANNVGWTLNGQVTDNYTSSTAISLQVFRKFSDNPDDVATDSDELLSDSIGATAELGAEGTFAIFVDPTDPSSTSIPQANFHFVHYLVQARDAKNNLAEATYTHILRQPSWHAATNGVSFVSVTEDTISNKTYYEPYKAPGTNIQAWVEVTGVTNGQPWEIYHGSNLAGKITHCFNLENSDSKYDRSCRFTPEPNYHTNGVIFKTPYQLRTTDGITTNPSYNRFSISIINVNDPPTINFPSNTWTIRSTSSSAIDLSSYFNDVDGDTVTVKTFTGTGVGSNHIDNSPTSSIDFLGGGHTVTSHTIQVTDGTLDSEIVNLTVYRLKDQSWLNTTGDNNFNNNLNFCDSFNLPANQINFGHPWEINECQSGVTTIGSKWIFLHDSYCNGNCDATITQDISVGKTTLHTQYTGTVTLQAGVNLKLSDSLYMDGGTFDATNSTNSKIEFGTTGNWPSDGIPFVGIIFRGNTSLFNAPPRILFKPISRPSQSNTIYPFQFLNGANTNQFIHNNGVLEMDASESNSSGSLQFTFTGNDLHVGTIRLTDTTHNTSSANLLAFSNGNTYIHGDLDLSGVTYSSTGGDSNIKIYNHERYSNPPPSDWNSNLGYPYLYGNYIEGENHNRFYGGEKYLYNHETYGHYASIYLIGNQNQTFTCAESNNNATKFIVQKSGGNFSFDSLNSSSDNCRWGGVQFESSGNFEPPPYLTVAFLKFPNGKILGSNTDLTIHMLENTFNPIIEFPSSINDSILNKLTIKGPRTTQVPNTKKFTGQVSVQTKLVIEDDLNFDSGTDHHLDINNNGVSNFKVYLAGDLDLKTLGSTIKSHEIDIVLNGNGDQSIQTIFSGFDNIANTLGEISVNKASGNLVLTEGDFYFQTLAIASNTSIIHNGFSLNGTMSVSNGVTLNLDAVNCSPSCTKHGLGDIDLDSNFAGTINFTGDGAINIPSGLDIEGSGTINFNGATTINLNGLNTANTFSGALNFGGNQTIHSGDHINIGGGTINFGSSTTFNPNVTGLEFTIDNGSSVTFGNDVDLSHFRIIMDNGSSLTTGSGLNSDYNSSHLVDNSTLNIGSNCTLKSGLILNGNNNNASALFGDGCQIQTISSFFSYADAQITFGENSNLSCYRLRVSNGDPAKISVGTNSTVNVNLHIDAVMGHIDLKNASSLSINGDITLHPTTTFQSSIWGIKATYGTIDLPQNTDTTINFRNISDSESTLRPFHLQHADAVINHNNGTVIFDFGHQNYLSSEDLNILMTPIASDNVNYYPMNFYNLTFKDSAADNTGELVFLDLTNGNIIVNNILDMASFENNAGDLLENRHLHIPYKIGGVENKQFVIKGSFLAPRYVYQHNEGEMLDNHHSPNIKIAGNSSYVSFTCPDGYFGMRLDVAMENPSQVTGYHATNPPNTTSDTCNFYSLKTSTGKLQNSSPHKFIVTEIHNLKNDNIVDYTQSGQPWEVTLVNRGLETPYISPDSDFELQNFTIQHEGTDDDQKLVYELNGRVVVAGDFRTEIKSSSAGHGWEILPSSGESPLSIELYGDWLAGQLSSSTTTYKSNFDVTLMGNSNQSIDTSNDAFALMAHPANKLIINKGSGTVTLLDNLNLTFSTDQDSLLQTNNNSYILDVNDNNLNVWTWNDGGGFTLDLGTTGTLNCITGSGTCP